ncbi:MAG: zinc-ribbon and FHA domain-containing protein [Actinomycetota bacterium]|nr:zinc-ribbon and FHA domain-containing protein [Actinomycetota bacterium]
MTGVFCNQCGHQNPSGSNFCSSCGAVLEHKGEDQTTTTTITFQPVESAGEVAEEEIAVTLDEVAAGFGVLVVKRGPNAGSRFVLEADLTRVGRHPESDIFLDDITVSRRHAEFAYRGDRYVVRDVGSLNGTYVNRERIEEGPLHNGDEVQIGKFRLVFLASVNEG